jgi:hypothetical protein
MSKTKAITPSKSSTFRSGGDAPQAPKNSTVKKGASSSKRS